MTTRRLWIERGALLLSLSLIGVNIATTGRWADVPGALRGWRWPWVTGAVAATAWLTFRPSREVGASVWLSRTVGALGAAVLLCCLLLAWFPPSAWPLIPFLDDWPPRFLSTVEGIRLLRHGAFAGWQWNLLGGYSTATDITQSLTLFGVIPMLLLGDEVGFHLLHLALFSAVPLLVFFDLRRERERNIATLAAGLVALAMAGQGWTLIRSGDTNSLTGLVAALLVLSASSRARAGRRFSFTGLVGALAIAVFAHVGFFVYAVGLLVLEAAYYKDARHAVRVAAAASLACVVSLPLTYELVRYPSHFVANNVLYEPPQHINWLGVLRRIYYNTEILAFPWRWFNDPQGLTSLFLPLVLIVAWKRNGRAGFHAWAALFAFALLRLNVPEAGYVFMRPEHLLAVFTPIALAAVLSETRDRWQAASLALLFALCFQISWIELPHQRAVDEFVPELAARIRTLDGNLIVLENNPHRDVAAGSGTRSERSLYGVHYEALIPSATNKRLYAGYWDGWQWIPQRGEMLAAGAWKGRMLSTGDQEAFVAEMRRWGARHVLVWSSNSKRAFSAWNHFALKWEQGSWQHFELIDPGADMRSVVTDHGSGELVGLTQLSGIVRLSDVREGTPIIVRTRFHPSWSVTWRNVTLPAMDAGGQLAFVAPANGSYDVQLVYPPRRWLLLVSLLTLCGSVIVESRLRRRPAAACQTDATPSIV